MLGQDVPTPADLQAAREALFGPADSTGFVSPDATGTITVSAPAGGFDWGTLLLLGLVIGIVIYSANSD